MQPTGKIKPNERQYQANENQDARITLLDFHEKETKLILREQVDDYVYRNNSNFIRARIKETFFDLRLRLDRDQIRTRFRPDLGYLCKK